jgi:hypothetical protein
MTWTCVCQSKDKVDEALKNESVSRVWAEVGDLGLSDHEVERPQQ